ncbi:MAG TPA: cytochrome c oxidase subunit 3, partial [Oxalobacteraceae bacterium]|nr:cytochrome c oxidase subunit 3 [Oxalobacteraceae bacterium]
MSSQHANAPYYFVPGPSQWPVLAGASLLLTMAGAAAWVNDLAWGPYANIAGILSFLVVLYNWFGNAIGESEAGKYNARVDTS